MDYEKKYNEALSQARFYYGNCPTEPEKKKLENIFPELRESEDERIRKDIRLVVESSATKYFKETGQMPEWYDRIVAYLEKQKEQKPVISDEAIRDGVVHFGITQYQIDNWLKKHINIVEYQPAEWSEEDERYINGLIGLIEDMKVGINPKLRGVAADRCIAFLKSLRPQPHWKPSEEQMNCLCASVDAAIRKHNESVSGYKPARVLKSLYEQLQRLM